MVNDYKTKLQQDEIRLRIQKSATENNARIQKMKTVNQLVEKLYKEAKHKMMTKQKDTAIYKELIKNLIVQVSKDNLINIFIGTYQAHGSRCSHQMQKDRFGCSRISLGLSRRRVQKANEEGGFIFLG